MSFEPPARTRFLRFDNVGPEKRSTRLKFVPIAISSEVKEENVDEVEMTGQMYEGLRGWSGKSQRG